MRRAAQHRLMFSLVVLAAVSAYAGYRLAPQQPWIFAHLPPGAYVASFDNAQACRAARRAYADARDISTIAQITVGKDFVDYCAQQIDPDGEPFVRLDIAPVEPLPRVQDQKPTVAVVPQQQRRHRRPRHRCIMCEAQ